MRWYLIAIILLAGCNQPVTGAVALGGEVSVHYIDVGQGDSTLIILPNNETVLIDCGQSNKGQDIINYLGYKQVIEVNKVRRKTKYKDFEICLDQVEGLGSFIEVEKMSDQDASVVQEELFEFLKQLGIREQDQVHKGYDTLLFEKNKEGM